MDRATDRPEPRRITFHEETQPFVPDADPDTYEPELAFSHEFAPYFLDVLHAIRTADFAPTDSDTPEETEEEVLDLTNYELAILNAAEKLHALVREYIRGALPDPPLPASHPHFALQSVVQVRAEQRLLERYEHLFTLLRDAVAGRLGDYSSLLPWDAKLPLHLADFALEARKKPSYTKILRASVGLVRGARLGMRQQAQLCAPDLTIPNLPPLLDPSTVHVHLFSAYRITTQGYLDRVRAAVEALRPLPSFKPIQLLINALEQERSSQQRVEMRMMTALLRDAIEADTPAR